MHRNHKTAWTQEQEDLLLDNYGHKPMSYFERILGRSPGSIRQKVKEIEGSFNMHEAGGQFSATQIAKILGVSGRTVVDWIKERNFPAERLSERVYFIKPEAVWKWVAANKERIPFQHVKQGELLPEPDWVRHEIRHAYVVKRPVNWTDEEKNRAWSMHTQGISTREIAAILQRPYKGTQRQMSAIKKERSSASPPGTVCENKKEAQYASL